MDPITIGMTALSVGSGLFGMFGNKKSGQVNPQMAAAYNQFEMQNNELEQRRMNLDATRRKRDIIRQAQVATANAENAAANGGAINSSGIEGARAGISGQAGVNYLGVSQNQEIGNTLYTNQRAMGLLNYQMQGQKATTPNYGALGAEFMSNNTDQLTRLLKWGFNIK